MQEPGVIKTDQFGVVTAPWDQVDSMKSDKPINVVLQDGKTVQRTLATTDGREEVAGQRTRYSIPQANSELSNVG